MRKKLGRPVLAEGEVTGHAHVLDRDVDVFDMGDGYREFNLISDTKVNHEEHHTIVLSAGEKESGIVQEFDFFEQEARNVQD